MGSLSVKTNGRGLQVEREPGEMLDKIYVPVPEGAGGEFEYEIAFTASGGEGSARIPLVVPAVPTADDTSNVTLTFAVPEGRYLYESFPVVEADGGGAATTDMTSFPSFGYLADNPLGLDPVVPGVLVSLVLFVAVSLATKPVPRESLDPFFGGRNGAGVSETGAEQRVRGGAAG